MLGIPFAPMPAPSAPRPSADCPCGSGTRWPAYAACCGRWHAGPLHLHAPDAACLMRSRYSAYVLELGDYLLATWHPSTRPAAIHFEPGLRWLGLQVQPAVAAEADRASVAFVARSKWGGRAHRLVENSRFVREQGRWYYLDGNGPG